MLARGFIQEPNTAPMAPQSCSSGSCGKGWPSSAPTMALYSPTTCRQWSGERAVSSVTPASSLAFSMISSKRWWSTPSTTEPYIWMKRR